MSENEQKRVFEVGQTYKTRGGKEVKVLLRLQHDNFSKYPLLVLSVDHSEFWTATEQGMQYDNETSERDLLPPEKPTTPFEVGKVYKSNNGLYYKVVRINDEDDDNDYPIIADCVGNDEEGSLEGDGYEYEEESFTLDGIFIIGSRDDEDDLIPTPVEWPPIKKPVNTPFSPEKTPNTKPTPVTPEAGKEYTLYRLDDNGKVCESFDLEITRVLNVGREHLVWGVQHNNHGSQVSPFSGVSWEESSNGFHVVPRPPYVSTLKKA